MEPDTLVRSPILTKFVSGVIVSASSPLSLVYFVISGFFLGLYFAADSEILRISSASYKRLFKSEPAVKAIHAGLECGLFLEKYPYLDMISFGPTIVDPHSPSERISIHTTEKFWKLLLEVLMNIPKIG